MFTNIHHISLSVSDLDQSIAFYKQLGFENAAVRRNLTSDYFRRIIAYPDGIVHTALLSGPFPVRLELMQYVEPVGARLDLATANIGSTHICFIVEGIHAEVERLKNAGVRFKSDIVAIDAGPNKGAYGVYLLDPDGYTMELLQLAPASDAPAAADGRPS